jgi:hypothetical protein
MFSKLTVNLACRGDNTKQVCLKHLMYSGDSFAIPFSHEKCNQRGDDLTKRLVLCAVADLTWQSALRLTPARVLIGGQK